MEKSDILNDERFKKLSPTMRASCKVLVNALWQILTGECSEDEVSETLASVNPENKGYKREDDYLTIDAGMRLFGFGKNRMGFCNLMKKNGIPNEKFNTVHIGYNKQKVLAVKHKMEEEYQKRIYKQEIKRRKEKNLQKIDKKLENF